MFDIVLSVIMGLFLLAIMIEYWKFTLFVIGVIVINMFTLWASLAIFVIGIIIQSYYHIRDRTLTLRIFFREIVFISAVLTVVTIITALIVQLMVNFLGSIGTEPFPCEELNPRDC